jgi:glycerophosphoryl diester phosphodiesterase
VALRRAPIAATNWADLEQAEISPGAHIPRLSDVFAMVGRRAAVYVEIKGRDIEALVAATLREADCRCAVHSFEYAAIERMQSMAPDVPRGLLFDRYPRNLVDAISRAGARDIWPKWSLVDQSLVDIVHRAGGRAIAWTVNDPTEAARLVDLGVDGICSDDLRLIR